jgi:hypothetical protein
MGLTQNHCSQHRNYILTRRSTYAPPLQCSRLGPLWTTAQCNAPQSANVAVAASGTFPEVFLRHHWRHPTLVTVHAPTLQSAMLEGTGTQNECTKYANDRSDNAPPTWPPDACPYCAFFSRFRHDVREDPSTISSSWCLFPSVAWFGRLCKLSCQLLTMACDIIRDSVCCNGPRLTAIAFLNLGGVGKRWRLLKIEECMSRCNSLLTMIDASR